MFSPTKTTQQGKSPGIFAYKDIAAHLWVGKSGLGGFGYILSMYHQGPWMMLRLQASQKVIIFCINQTTPCMEQNTSSLIVPYLFKPLHVWNKGERTSGIPRMTLHHTWFRGTASPEDRSRYPNTDRIRIQTNTVPFARGPTHHPKPGRA